MGLFGFGSKKDKAPKPSADAVVVSALYELACAYLNKPPQGIHVEDLISALAAVTGEACIRTQGEFDVDTHGYAPGSMVLSDAINRRLCDDAPAWDKTPSTSILGAVYQSALAAGYAAEDFPPLAEVFRTLVAGAAGETQWGFVPLSVEDRPFLRPLQAAYELRGPVRGIFETHGAPLAQQPWLCACALGRALGAVRQAIRPAAAAAIAVETVNGMAKMAPMTAAHMAELEKQPQA